MKRFGLNAHAGKSVLQRLLRAHVRLRVIFNNSNTFNFHTKTSHVHRPSKKGGCSSGFVFLLRPYALGIHFGAFAYGLAIPFL